MTSRLEELIAELCPNGVEYKKVKDTYLRIKGTPITASKMKEIASEDGEVRIFAGGKTVINAHESDIPRANITRVPAVLVQSRGVIDAVYYDKPFTFKNEMWAYTSNNPISVKFLYYLLKNNIQYFRDAASGMGSLPQISLHVTEDFEIPVPPLDVQAEIVRILDTFTELTAELTAELTDRKKQYEYYRDTLLTFNDNNPLHSLIQRYCPNGVEYKKIGDIATIVRGASPRPIMKFITNSLQGVNWIKIGDVNSGDKYITHTAEKITLDGAKKSRLVKKGDFILSNSMSFGRPYILKIDGCIHDGWLAISDFSATYMSDFLYYVLSSSNCQNDMRKKASFGGAVKNLNADIVRELILPVPPLEVQRQIVQILDRFDALCNDLTQGLPAEIEARRKQYEYYRDQLLTFKRA